jgi:hypothetical protein
MGDSKVIIDWINLKGNLNDIITEGWKQRIRDLLGTFKGISFQHIYRESNDQADHLSKLALSKTKGRLTYFSWDGSSAGHPQHVIFS